VKKIEYEDDDPDDREPSNCGSWGSLPVKRDAMAYGPSRVKRNPVKVRNTSNITAGRIKEIV
jgi:hypothetical protein